MIALLLLACNDQSLHQVPDVQPGDLGSIAGRVCDPATSTWLEGALVYTNLFDENGAVYATAADRTDAEGRWQLTDLRAGSYDITVQAGNAILELFTVELEEGEDLVLPDPPCFEETEAAVAVVTGDYDDFAGVAGALGLPSYVEVDGQDAGEIVDFLTNPDELAAFDVVFFDGGHLEDGVIYSTQGADPTVDAVIANLQDYVAQGGIVVASDWSYDVVERAWPDAVDFLGDDTVPDDAQRGEPGPVQAEVVDSGLAAQLGISTVDLLYDLSVWPVIESVGAGTNVHLRADATWREGFDLYTTPDSPMLVSFGSGKGTVILSTYRNAANADTDAIDMLRALLDAAGMP